eukprot:jgi/Mesen1/2377/ME000156S01516
MAVTNALTFSFSLLLVLLASPAVLAGKDLVVVHANQVKNEVLVFQAGSKGVLELKQRPYGYSEPGVDGNITSAGRGNDPTGTQGALAVDQRDVFVVNGGEGTVSWLRFDSRGSLKFVAKSPSVGGTTFLATLAVNRKLGVVVAADVLGKGSLYAFKYRGNKLAPYPQFLGEFSAAKFDFQALGGRTIAFGSTPDIFSIVTAVAQVSFSPRSDYLIVVVKSTGLWLFDIVDGKLTAPYHNNLGTTPPAKGNPLPINKVAFGFSTSRISDIETALFLTAALDFRYKPFPSGGVESYKIVKLRPGKFVVAVVSALPANAGGMGAGLCWSFVHGRYLYATSPDSPAIYSYKIDDKARLKILQSNLHPTYSATPKPLDVVGSEDGKYIYVNIADKWDLKKKTARASIATYKAGSNGKLTFVGGTYLPALAWPTAPEGLGIYYL